MTTPTPKPDRKYPRSFDQKPVRRSYGELRLAIEVRAGRGGSIDYDRANEVHRKWKRLGKLAAQGPASLMK